MYCADKVVVIEPTEQVQPAAKKRKGPTGPGSTLQRVVSTIRDFSGETLSFHVLIQELIRVLSLVGGGKKASYIHRAIAQMIIRDNLPLMATKKKGMIKCYKMLFPNYTLPCPNTIIKIAKEFDSKSLTMIKASLRERRSDVAVTMDLVTLAKTSKTFLVMTAHFLNKNYELQVISLGSVRMKEVRNRLKFIHFVKGSNTKKPLDCWNSPFCYRDAN